MWWGRGENTVEINGGNCVLHGVLDGSKNGIASADRPGARIRVPRAVRVEIHVSTGVDEAALGMATPGGILLPREPAGRPCSGLAFVR